MVKISEGNTKLGRIPNINLPPGMSCEPGIPCLNDGCYAMKAYRQYPKTRDAWLSNLQEFKTDSEKFFTYISNWIKSKSKPYFRWHSAGDFVNQEYLDGVLKTCRENPNTKFLAFTKRFTLNYSKKPKNLNIVFSMWPGLNKPQWNGCFSWMNDGLDTRIPLLNNTYICPGSCKTCNICWTKTYKNIIFNKH